MVEEIKEKIERLRKQYQKEQRLQWIKYIIIIFSVIASNSAFIFIIKKISMIKDFLKIS